MVLVVRAGKGGDELGRPAILGTNWVVVKHLDVVYVAWLGLGCTRGSILQQQILRTSKMTTYAQFNASKNVPFVDERKSPISTSPC